MSDLLTEPVHAFAIAREEFEGVTDKVGDPYSDHLVRVLGYTESVIGRELLGPFAPKPPAADDVAIAALLHDLIEDTAYELWEDESGVGMRSGERSVRLTEAVWNALNALTKRKDESYERYLGRVMGDEIALVVKAGDLRDNTDPERLKRLEPAERQRLLLKYLPARLRIDLALYASWYVGKPPTQEYVQMFRDGLEHKLGQFRDLLGLPEEAVSVSLERSDGTLRYNLDVKLDAYPDLYARIAP